MDRISKIVAIKAMNKLYSLGYLDLSRQLHKEISGFVEQEIQRGESHSNIALNPPLLHKVRQILAEHLNEPVEKTSKTVTQEEAHV